MDRRSLTLTLDDKDEVPVFVWEELELKLEGDAAALRYADWN